ncbi:MAG: ABC transporter substrate-binding protein [Thermaerobacter sp.]|nr:ABC transporter substrate-binding protein [Thermaerobacter sp.]
MKTGRWAALGGLIGTAALTLAACGGGTAPASSQAPLQKASEMVAALPTQVGITDFAPIANISAYSIYNSQVEYMMWAPVVMVSGQDTIDWADSLASKITPSNNDQTFTVTLKPWKWSNGTPITAQDVAFTANLLLQACIASSPPYSYGGCGFGGIPPITGHPELKSVTAQGNNTVVFTTSAPSNPTWFELNALGQIQPMPQSIWDKGSVTADLNLLKQVYNDPTNAVYNVVSGPYKFSSFSNNQYWKFVPNKQYGGPKATVSVSLQYEASDSAEFAALKTEKINAGYLTASMFGSAGQLAKQYSQSKTLGFCWYGVTLNSASDALDVGPAFQDTAVRQALQYGVDEAAIGKVLDGVLNGKSLSVPNYSAIPSGFPSLTQAVFGVSSIPAQFPYDPAKGKALLLSDGYKMVNGVMTKGNIKLQFPVNIDSGSTEDANAALILQQDWAQMGVKISINPEAFDSLIAITNTTAGESSKWAVNWTGGWCYEPNFYPTGGGMWSYYDSVDSYNNKDFNNAVNQSYAPGTAAQAQQNMYAYALATAKDLPMLWMPSGYALNETAPYLHGTSQWFNPVQAFTQWNHLTISH